MKSPRQDIEALIARIATDLFGSDAAPGPYVRPCLDSRHGDFQTNVALVQGKATKQNPRDLAAKIAGKCRDNPVTLPPEIAGPGFVNFRLKPEYAAAQVRQRLGAPKLGVDPASPPLAVLVEYSSPTPLKEMHVGHLRSTIIGDALARIFRFLGHRVTTDNHLGDWGTGWGMVIAAHKRSGSEERLKADPLAYLEDLYTRANRECADDPARMEEARAEILKLQQGDPASKAIWEKLLAGAKSGLAKIYAELGSTFDMCLGESFYQDRLKSLVDEMLAAGIARRSEGAVVVFYDDDPKLKDHPFMIQKSDGAFLYSTTDLATVEYRVDKLKSDLIVVCTDGRQQMHFQQVIAAMRRWKYPKLRMENAWFGTILGEDKKPLKGRTGGTIKLRELLDEAQERAGAIIAQKRPELSESDRRELARVVGIGAIKYADLCQNRNLDYVFSWDKLLAFDGNTAPYLQNAYVRIRAIFRKAGPGEIKFPEKLDLRDEAELVLAKKLLDFGDAVGLVAEEHRPHYLCVYLFELATAFHQFYEKCPVLQAEPVARGTRLALCQLTADTLKTGLNLLGIETVEQM